VAGVVVFSCLTVAENRRLEGSRNELLAANSAQTREIRRLSSAAVAYNSTIETFTAKYDKIARSYVASLGGAACSTREECSHVGSVPDEAVALRSALRELKRSDRPTDSGQSSVAKTDEELSSLSSSIPTLWPAQGNVSSVFGGRRDPFAGGASFHSGLDITAPYGEKVVAAGSGVVISAAGKGDGYGNKVVIKHGYDVSTLYGHLSSVLVEKGQRVEEGDLIGRVGSTGRSTGDHLHFEIRVDGAPVNPLAYLTSDTK
jgi:murein DD-endopeptidase MepM/ murein hydrolase activator NlpD